MAKRTVLEVSRIWKVIENRISGIQQLNAFQHDFAIAPLVTLSLNDLLQLVAGATDGEALVVKEIPDPANHQNLVVLVIPAIATPFHRAQLSELLLPIPEHMRFDPAQVAYFTDREVALCRNGWKNFLQLNQCTKKIKR